MLHRVGECGAVPTEVFVTWPAVSPALSSVRSVCGSRSAATCGRDSLDEYQDKNISPKQWVLTLYRGE